MVAVPVTLWKPYMTKFMVTLAVRWVIPPLLVTFFAMASFWVTFDPVCLQDLILSSSFITQTLTAYSPFGRQSITASGLHVDQLKAEPGLFLEMPLSMATLVCHIFNLRTIRLGTYSPLRPDAFLEYAERVLGLVGDHYDRRSPLLIPGI